MSDRRHTSLRQSTVTYNIPSTIPIWSILFCRTYLYSVKCNLVCSTTQCLPGYCIITDSPR